MSTNYFYAAFIISFKTLINWKFKLFYPGAECAHHERKFCNKYINESCGLRCLFIVFNVLFFPFQCVLLISKSRHSHSLNDWISIFVFLDGRRIWDKFGKSYWVGDKSNWRRQKQELPRSVEPLFTWLWIFYACIEMYVSN